jgi:hypothetical protein
MRYALPTKQKYPIETAEQIKTAAAYFDKYLGKMHPAERVAIAENMEKRASELGVLLENDWVHNYNRKGPSYSPDFDMHMKMRKEACMARSVDHHGKRINAADLLDKVASLKSHIKPQEMVDLLNDFDKKANLTADYDRKIRDPFFTVYGSSTNPSYDMRKLAADMSSKQLEHVALNDSFISKLASAYGKDFADGFKQDPVNVYDSMPAPDKQNILNIARESKDEA